MMTTDTDCVIPEPESYYPFSLREYPPALAALALGTINFGVMLKNAKCIGVPRNFGTTMQWVLLPICAMLLLGYITKVACLLIKKQPNKDTESQGGLASLAAGAMCLMGIGAQLRDKVPVVGVVLWVVGIVLHLAICARFIYFSIVVRGLKASREQLNAYTVVPTVGLAAAAATGASMPAELRPVAVACLGLGIVFTVFLVPTILFEMIRPKNQHWSQPCAAILAAPVSLCSVGWLALGGEVDGKWSVVTHLLAYSAMCVATPVLVMLPRLLSLPFGFTWAAYTFPLAITAINALKMCELTDHHGWHIVAMTTVSICTLTVVSVWAGTLWRAVRNACGLTGTGTPHDSSTEKRSKFGAPGYRARPLEIRTTSINMVGSQGLFESDDRSVALLHESTAPPNYFRSKYGSRQVLNMDRGGFGQSDWGTNFGCVFDGVSTGGKINVYAAQAFAEVCIKWLGQHHPVLDKESCQEYARELFQMAMHRQHNPGLRNPAFDADGGSATGSFAVFERCADGSAVVHGAALGDAAAILVSSSGEAKQLNLVSRLGEDELSRRCDTGGMISMGGMMSGDPFPFCHQVQPEDLVVLTTDGLTDNVADASVLPFVIGHTWFDTLEKDVSLQCPWLAKGSLEFKKRDRKQGGEVKNTSAGSIDSVPHLPSVEELREFIASQAGAEKYRLEELTFVSAATASQRLFNYLGWVTRNAFDQEESYFGVQSEYNELMKTHLEAEHAARAAGEEQPPLPAEAQKYRAEMKKQEKAKRRLPCKTDDVIIVTMRPFHRQPMRRSADSFGEEELSERLE
jgi:exfoliative toxin A/B